MHEVQRLIEHNVFESEVVDKPGHADYTDFTIDGIIWFDTSSRRDRGDRGGSKARLDGWKGTESVGNGGVDSLVIHY